MPGMLNSMTFCVLTICSFLIQVPRSFAESKLVDAKHTEADRASEVPKTLSYSLEVKSDRGVTENLKLYYQGEDTTRVEWYEEQKLFIVDVGHRDREHGVLKRLYLWPKSKNATVEIGDGLIEPKPDEPRYLCQVPTPVWMARLPKLASTADRTLGQKAFGQRRATGYEVDHVDWLKSHVRFWLDDKSGSPIHVEMKKPQVYCAPLKYKPVVAIFSDIRWNPDLDPNLFPLLPPAGYAVDRNWIFHNGTLREGKTLRLNLNDHCVATEEDVEAVNVTDWQRTPGRVDVSFRFTKEASERLKTAVMENADKSLRINFNGEIDNSCSIDVKQERITVRIHPSQRTAIAFQSIYLPDPTAGPN